MIERPELLLAAWWGVLAPLAIQAALLLGLVALADRLLPRRTWPELRLALWLLVPLRLVTPPQLASPVAVWGLLPSFLLPDSMSGVLAVGAPADLDAGLALRLVQVAFGIWLAGLVAVGGTLALRRRATTVLLDRASRPASDPALEALAADAASQLGLARVPRLRVLDEARTPFVLGWRVPTIYLPPRVAGRDDAEEYRHVLLHELAHVRRRDLLVAALCQVVAVLHWYHPAGWIACRRLAGLREACCDRTVASVLGEETPRYRRTLLRLAGRLAGLPVPQGAGLLRGEAGLLLRLHLLEGVTRPRTTLRRGASIALLVAATALGLPAAAHATRTAETVGELIERPPGCLQLRLEVLRRLAEEERNERTPPADERRPDQRQERER